MQYAVMFVPIVAGIVLGSLAAERLAGQIASARLILAGLSIQLVTDLVNVTFHAAHAATVPWGSSRSHLTNGMDSAVCVVDAFWTDREISTARQRSVRQTRYSFCASVQVIVLSCE
jgi:hypothetical protein